MDGSQFDALLRTLAGSRRGFLGGALAAVGGLLVAPRVNAKKKRHHKKRKPKAKPNEFGCLDVGQPCGGNDGKCCSGICEGKKPKTGKNDTSVCVGHDDAGVCFADTDTCTLGQGVSCDPDNLACSCVLTTGNAGFCGDFTAGPTTLCHDCTKDADCQAELGPRAACVFFAGACSTYCPATGRTACVPSCA